MARRRALGLVDRDGQPLPARVLRVLEWLLPRLRRRFPSLDDEAALVDVLEEAGRRITDREARHGPIEKLHAYAWVALCNVASSRLRTGANLVRQRTLDYESERLLATVPATRDSADEVERSVLMRELLEALSPDERDVVLWKMAGFSSPEIAALRGRSVAWADKVFSRARMKLRDSLGTFGSRSDEG
jgi:RNA polymerase sigma factor (sigma-70 family)